MKELEELKTAVDSLKVRIIIIKDHLCLSIKQQLFLILTQNKDMAITVQLIMTTPQRHCFVSVKH